MLEDTRERVIVEESIGSFITAERSYDGKLQAAWAQPSTPLTYEQVAHIFEAGIKTATPSGTGPYVRAYNYPYGGTTVPTIKTYTIETGSSVVAEDQYEMEYSIVESFEPPDLMGETLKITLIKYSSDGTEVRKTVRVKITGVINEMRDEPDWSIYLPMSDMEGYLTWANGKRPNRDKDGIYCPDCEQ